MYRIVITSHYDTDKFCETSIEVNAYISHLAHINRSFDIYKDNVLVATGGKEGVKIIKRNKLINGTIKYCKESS